MSDSVNERVPLRDGTEGLPEARELPRPATPGPWKAGGRLGEIDMSGTVFTVNADNRHVAYCHARPGDGPAIAALPEWIEDRDRWKARAEQAEAAVARADRELCDALDVICDTEIEDAIEHVRAGLKDAE